VREREAVIKREKVLWGNQHHHPFLAIPFFYDKRGVFIGIRRTKTTIAADKQAEFLPKPRNPWAHR